jgi:hypothetical protein
MTEEMVYVAADPQQPGAAWAICVDDGKFPKDVARFVAETVKEGGHVMRVERAVGIEMLMKWVRPHRAPERREG